MSFNVVRFSFTSILLSLGFFCLTFFASVKSFSNNSCQQIFSEFPFEKPRDNLYGSYLDEIYNLNESQIKELNRTTLERMNAYIPPRQIHRAQSIFWSDAQNLIDAVYNHAVIGFKNQKKYNADDGSETGFCFGRAMYVHLTLLRMGLQKESIKKIWAVGPIKNGSGQENWGYHVATIAFSKKDGWIVIDANEMKPRPLAKWMQEFNDRSVDQRLRFYVTEPEKMALYTGKYNWWFLGLNLSRDSDYFKNYFVDLLAAVRTESLQSLNLHKIDISTSYSEQTTPFVPTPIPDTFMEKMIDFFWR
jgi:hypothetical protein